MHVAAAAEGNKYERLKRKNICLLHLHPTYICWWSEYLWYWKMTPFSIGNIRCWSEKKLLSFFSLQTKQMLKRRRQDEWWKGKRNGEKDRRTLGFLTSSSSRETSQLMIILDDEDEKKRQKDHLFFPSCSHFKRNPAYYRRCRGRFHLHLFSRPHVQDWSSKSLNFVPW